VLYLESTQGSTPHSSPQSSLSLEYAVILESRDTPQGLAAALAEDETTQTPPTSIREMSDACRLYVARAHTTAAGARTMVRTLAILFELSNRKIRNRTDD
jgi:hypothetical protein